MIENIILYTAQFLLLVVFFTTLYCEMSKKYKEMNNLKIKDKNEQQQKLIKILKELRTNIYEQI